MKYQLTLTAGAVLTLALSATLAAKPKGSIAVTDASRGASARTTLAEIKGLAMDASAHADLLDAMERNAMFQPSSHLFQLLAIKEEINRIGKDAAALEAGHDSLPAWEQQAVDRLMPLLRDAASNTNKAIAYYNGNQERLWTKQDRVYAESIFNDTKQIARTVGNFLKYQHVREQEDRLAAALPTSEVEN